MAAIALPVEANDTLPTQTQAVLTALSNSVTAEGIVETSGTLLMNQSPRIVDRFVPPNGRYTLPIRVNNVTTNTVARYTATSVTTLSDLQSPVEVNWTATSATISATRISTGVENLLGYPWNAQTHYRVQATGASIQDVVYDAATNNLNIVYTNAPANWDMAYSSEEQKVDALRAAIKSNLLIRMGRTRESLAAKVSEAELRARDTLRDMLTESEWRRYVTNGFIMVKGQSGRWYQVFNRSNERIRVYENGKHINNICIHTDGECPPTDHVISMKILLEIDEQAVLKGGNIHAPSKNSWQPPRGSRKSLVDVARQIKEAPQVAISGTSWEITNSTIAFAS
jgi:hypothetical protein